MPDDDADVRLSRMRRETQRGSASSCGDFEDARASGWVILPESDEHERRMLDANNRLLWPMLLQLAQLDLSAIPVDPWDSYSKAPAPQ